MDKSRQLQNLLAAVPETLRDRVTGAAIAGAQSAMKAELAELPDAPHMSLLKADEILTAEWPEPVWAVPELLPAGLSIFAGKSKVGKSWLALQLAQAVGAGGKFFSHDVEEGPVLYLALEDSPRRLRDRMHKQSWPLGLPVDFLTLGRFVQEVGDLKEGGGERVARQIESRGYRLVVIDTLSRAVFGDQNDVAAMTAALAPIHEMAHRLNCAVTMIDHHNKLRGSNPDVVLDILGSTAKGALSDTIWGLYRQRGKAGAKLLVIGRDIQEQELELKWDALTGCWQLEETIGGVTLSENRRHILTALEDFAPASLAELTEILGRNKGTLYKELEELRHGGYVEKTGKGRGKIRYVVKENIPI